MRAIFFALVIIDVLPRDHGGITDGSKKLGSKSHKRGSGKHKGDSGSASHQDFRLESVKHKGKSGKHKGDSGSDYKDSDRSLK